MKSSNMRWNEIVRAHYYVLFNLITELSFFRYPLSKDRSERTRERKAECCETVQGWSFDSSATSSRVRKLPFTISVLSQVTQLRNYRERENAGLNVTCASKVFLLESVVHHAFELQGKRNECKLVDIPFIEYRTRTFSHRTYWSDGPD